MDVFFDDVGMRLALRWHVFAWLWHVVWCDPVIVLACCWYDVGIVLPCLLDAIGIGLALRCHVFVLHGASMLFGMCLALFDIFFG